MDNLPSSHPYVSVKAGQRKDPGGSKGPKGKGECRGLFMVMECYSLIWLFLALQTNYWVSFKGRVLKLLKFAYILSKNERRQIVIACVCVNTELGSECC